MATNPYLDALDLEEQRVRTVDSPTGAPARNPYLETLDADQAMRDTQRRAAMRTAATVNPDEAARANKLAAARGLPQELVLRNLPEVTQQDATDRADTLLQSSPALSNKMRELPFAQVAHDNVENLAGIEQHFKVTGEMRATRGPDPTLGSYLSGVWASVAGRAKQADIGLSMQVQDIAEALGAAPDTTRRNELQRRYQQAGSNVRLATPEFESETAKGVYGGVSSTVSMIPPLTLSLLSRSPTPALAAMGLQTESEAYGKYRSRGASAGEALVGGAAEGAIEVLTEKIPMGFLVDKFGKAGAKQFLAGMLLREVPSEQAATFLQDAVDTAVANPEKTWGEFWKERPAAAYQTLLATLTQTALVGGASGAARKLAERADNQRQVSEQDTATIETLLKLAEKDKLRERDPQAFAGVVQDAAEQHGVPGEVFIDAGALVEALAQSGMTPEQIENAIPSVKDELGAAVAAGGDVAIPVGEFTTLVAGSGMEQALVKHARLSADALSQEDLKLIGKVDLKAETESADAAQAVVDESASVRTQMLDQLNEAGRFSPAVNAAYADSVMAIYDTQAARLGVSVAEFAKQYPLNVRAESALGTAYDQPAGAEIRQTATGFEAFVDGKRVGRLESNLTPEQSKQLGEAASVDIVKVDKEFQNQGIGGALYAAFNAAHEGRIAPSGKTTAQAWAVWKRDFPEKVAEFVDQETKRLADGANRELVLGNITDAQVREAVASGAGYGGVLNQDPSTSKGTFTPSTNTIALLAKADLSTFHHELGHFYLEVLTSMAAQPNAPASVTEDMGKVLEWFGIRGDEAAGDGSKAGELAQDAPRPEAGSAVRTGKRSPITGKEIIDVLDTSGGKIESTFIADTPEEALQNYRERPARQAASRNRPPPPSFYLPEKEAQDLGSNWRRVKGQEFTSLDEDDGYLYHITSTQEAKGIRAEGLAPNSGGMFGNAYAAYSSGKVFVTERSGVSFWTERVGNQLEHRFDKPPAVVVLRIPKSKVTAKLEPDTLGTEDARAPAFFSRETLYQGGTDATSAEPVMPGRTPLETWQAMSLEQQRPYHEQFARGYEAYLFEGKAPSTALARAFQRFSEWMRHIYKSIRTLNVELNDDIRRVYDRMLASEEAIKEAEAARAYAPLFADEAKLKEAGVDAASYHALGAEATADAVNEMQARGMRDMRWLANAKNRALKALQKEAAAKREAIEAQVREEVGAMPVYAAENFLRRGALPEADRSNAQRKLLDATQGMNTKLDMAALEEMYGDAPAAPWRYLGTGKRGLATTKDGLHPDIVAEIFGFPSGDALVRELLGAEAQADVIEGMTDQRMLEQHGELSSPAALERAAEQAIRNEARGKFIATELAALDKAIGPVRVLVAAAKQFAEAVVDRTTIDKIKPNVFAAAETRAAKAAQKALGKSTEDAATAKRNQLLNHFAARYAHDAVDEVAKVRAFFKRVADTPDDKLKSRDIDVVNAARAVLAAYGVGRRGEAAADYLKRVAEYDPDMSGVLQGSVDAALANAKPLGQLTLNELRALNDEVASLWHMAKRSRQMEIDGNLMDREEIQEELKARLVEIGIPDTVPGDASAVTPAEARIAKLKTYLASARRTEGWVEAMDGKSTGGFRSYIWQPVKEAADAYRTDRAKLLKRYRDLLAPIAPTLRKQLIAAPELGYTFGKDTGGVAMKELLHAILHTGNQSNKRKLLLGRKWATELADGTLDTSRWDAFVKRMADEGTLTKAHFDFAQGTWDLLESTKPLAQKTHRDVFGKYFAEVTADPVDTPFGQYAGGYVPALADPRVVSDAKTRALMEGENDSMAFSFPATAKGFTKSRVEYNRPLMLDIGTLAQHIDKVLMFAHMERPIRDVRRVLTSKGVAYGVNRIDPAAFDSIITPWLNRAARQQVTTPSPGHWQSWRLWSTLRNRAGMAAMFGNVVNAAQQITGFSIAAVKVRPKYLLGALGHYVTNPRRMAQDVAALSPYMEGRISNEVAAMNDAIKDILIDPSLYERGQQWSMRHAYFLQSAVDNVMSPIIWIAARNQALEQGQDEREAGRFADATVRQTQGSTLPEDISNWESGSSFSRMFSQFAGYFNMQANLMGTEFQTVARDMGLRKGAGRGLYVLSFAFLVPAWISELIVQAFRGGPDDEDKDGEYLDDWLTSVFGLSTLRGATAMVPIFGQGINALVNATNKKPYDDRLATSPAVSMIESAARAPASLYNALFDDGDKSKAVKDVASLISLTTGIPANIAARPLSYVADVQEGDVNPTGPADVARGLVTGRASPGSK